MCTSALVLLESTARVNARGCWGGAWAASQNALEAAGDKVGALAYAVAVLA
eukprot:CAMPEP_0171064154 /NCGR_PEP_ID=MMETSP0766_2-20121228/6111_1 /TAXON_ID=439317 /ORGANISM="Gambierdiscus australes, Strain CAWD 149" /LENGTH=50 /DNA_ID=CAMNT_0011520157 /DNA_START=147 /DNA_END=295 /DNA_ORIENTATION=-